MMVLAITVSLFMLCACWVSGDSTSCTEQLTKVYSGGTEAGELTLRFYEDGSAYINQDEKCPGISAGNTGGGEVNVSLPGDFYQTMTAKEVAAQCWGNCYSDILERGVLDTLMKKAAKKHGFFHDYAR